MSLALDQPEIDDFQSYDFEDLVSDVRDGDYRIVRYDISGPEEASIPGMSTSQGTVVGQQFSQGAGDFVTGEDLASDLDKVAEKMPVEVIWATDHDDGASRECVVKFGRQQEDDDYGLLGYIGNAVSLFDDNGRDSAEEDLSELGEVALSSDVEYIGHFNFN